MVNAELLYAKALQQLGAAPEERLRKARARTEARTLILDKQLKTQAAAPGRLAGHATSGPAHLGTYYVRTM